MKLALVGPWCAARRNHPNLVGLNRPEGIWTNLVDPKEKNSLSYGGRRIACFCLTADGGGSRRSRRRPELILAGIALDLFFLLSRSLGDRAFGGSWFWLCLGDEKSAIN